MPYEIPTENFVKTDSKHSNNNSANWANLYDATYHKIFDYLDKNDLASVALVSKHENNLVKSYPVKFNHQILRDKATLALFYELRKRNLIIEIYDDDEGHLILRENQYEFIELGPNCNIDNYDGWGDRYHPGLLEILRREPELAARIDANATFRSLLENQYPEQSDSLKSDNMTSKIAGAALALVLSLGSSAIMTPFVLFTAVLYFFGKMVLIIRPKYVGPYDDISPLVCDCSFVRPIMYLPFLPFIIIASAIQNARIGYFRGVSSLLDVMSDTIRAAFACVWGTQLVEQRHDDIYEPGVVVGPWHAIPSILSRVADITQQYRLHKPNLVVTQKPAVSSQASLIINERTTLLPKAASSLVQDKMVEHDIIDKQENQVNSPSIRLF